MGRISLKSVKTAKHEEVAWHSVTCRWQSNPNIETLPQDPHKREDMQWRKLFILIINSLCNMLSSTSCHWSPSEKKKRAVLVTLLSVKQLISHVRTLFFEFILPSSSYSTLKCTSKQYLCIILLYNILYKLQDIYYYWIRGTQQVHFYWICKVVIFSKRYKLFLDLMLYITWPLCYILHFYLIFFLCTIRQSCCNKVNLPWRKEGSLSVVYIANILWHCSYKLDFMSQHIVVITALG